MPVRKMSSEVVDADEPKDKFGDVEVMKSVTIQVVDYNPVTTSIAVRLPIERGETPTEAIRRTLSIVEEELTDAVGKACDEGLQKYWAKAKRR